ncbi:hypothetical protein M0E87_04110 [Corynebacterium sp. CCM 9185]|uniref:RDD family protein n=1 Tax=Corynebacterium marambiense TaxID=2765364 RepID=A0ABS0VVR6_9CORY|nr:hypothetical protein [Corynebacterium marambiense]MBI9000884.1 hypothetical protein [Corynebacterium marambiense]MCK7662848.1 hypothetical protein [Corynebacterium marambiense]MCX7542457.1 hypothetical protein [Corynebacterium marambiense]
MLLGVVADRIVDPETLEQLIGEAGTGPGIVPRVLRGISYLALVYRAWRIWQGSGSARIWLLDFALFDLLVDGAIIELAGDRLNELGEMAAVRASIVLLLALSGDVARVWSAWVSGRLLLDRHARGLCGVTDGCRRG